MFKGTIWQFATLATISADDSSIDVFLYIISSKVQGEIAVSMNVYAMSYRQGPERRLDALSHDST